jgi:hypothetical protein
VGEALGYCEAYLRYYVEKELAKRILGAREGHASLALRIPCFETDVNVGRRSVTEHSYLERCEKRGRTALSI